MSMVMFRRFKDDPSLVYPTTTLLIINHVFHEAKVHNVLFSIQVTVSRSIKHCIYILNMVRTPVTHILCIEQKQVLWYVHILSNSNAIARYHHQ